MPVIATARTRGTRRISRRPTAGASAYAGIVRMVTEAQTAKMDPIALQDEIVKRVAKGPAKFKLLVQLAQPGDPTNDATQIWPDNRPTVVLGEIDITKAVKDSREAEKQLLFLPTNLTNGIDESDDPLIDVRTAAYAESFGRRSNGQ